MNPQKQRKQKNGKEFSFLKEIDRDILINKVRPQSGKSGQNICIG